jgi:hypothetical protein
MRRHLLASLVVVAAALAYTLVPAPAQAANTWVLCNVTEVGHVDVNRVHVACSNSPGGMRFFAVRNADSELANRLISLGTAAMIHDLDLYLLYDPNDNSGPPFGCAASDCRPAKGVVVNR